MGGAGLGWWMSPGPVGVTGTWGSGRTVGEETGHQ